MSNPIKLLVFEKNGRHYAYSESVLAKIEVGEGDDKTKLDTPEKAQENFPGSRWHNIHVVYPFLEEHHEMVETRLMEEDEKTGVYWRNAAKLPATIVEVGVASWDLPWEHTADGFKKIPHAIAQMIGGLVYNECYYDMLDPTVFTKG